MNIHVVGSELQKGGESPLKRRAQKLAKKQQKRKGRIKESREKHSDRSPSPEQKLPSIVGRVDENNSNNDFKNSAKPCQSNNKKKQVIRRELLLLERRLGSLGGKTDSNKQKRRAITHSLKKLRRDLQKAIVDTTPKSNSKIQRMHNKQRRQKKKEGPKVGLAFFCCYPFANVLYFS
jgi:hypothetical protein